MSKKYYIIYIIKKEKFNNCDALFSKYIINNNVFIFYIIYIINL